MNFHEKSAWACLVSMLGTYAPYFVVVLREPFAGPGLFVAAAIGLVLLLTLFHMINAIADRSIRTTGTTPTPDELDRAIEGAAARWAGLVLAFAVMSWILIAWFAVLVAAGPAVPVDTALSAVHWLFAGFVFANLVYYGAIVVGHRRLALA
jgi:hypothetical protein